MKLSLLLCCAGAVFHWHPVVLAGRLWIHAASKQPDPAEIETLESFYRSLYESAGVTATFPAHYPTSALLGAHRTDFEMESWLRY